MSQHNTLGEGTFSLVLGSLVTISVAILGFLFDEIPYPIFIAIACALLFFLVPVATKITNVKLSNIFLVILIMPAPFMAITVSVSDYFIAKSFSSFIPVVYNIFMLSFASWATSFFIEYQIKNNLISKTSLLQILSLAVILALSFAYYLNGAKLYGLTLGISYAIAGFHYCLVFSSLLLALVYTLFGISRKKQNKA